MNKWLIILSCIILFYSCTSNNQTNKNSKTVISKSFQLYGTIENFSSSKVYLNKLIENSIYSIDSAEIKDNQFIIQGVVDYPERFVLTFDNSLAKVVLIIENVPITVKIDSNNFNEPLVEGSELNALLNTYKNSSKTIFRKIDYLFPHFQKARLENDVKRIAEIGLDMKKIESEFKEFSFQFIEENKTSYIAPIILRDQLKISNIDTLRIKQSFESLSSEVKNSPDALLIATFLNSH